MNMGAKVLEVVIIFFF